MATRETDREKQGRSPVPEEARPDEAPSPQPELEEPRLQEGGLRDLSSKDWVAITKRSVKEMRDDNMPMIASALAYSAFFAIPSVLLVTVGLFTLIAGPSTITTLADPLHGAM